MEEKKHLIKADITQKMTDSKAIIITLYSVLVVCILVIGLIDGSGEKVTGWFFLWFSFEGRTSYLTNSTELIFYPQNIAIFVAIFAFLIAIPFILYLIYGIQCKNTELKITESQVIGSYSSFLSKKTLQIPIEKVDNLTVMSGFLDKFRSGKTLGVCSASGVIKLHFVQNAEEVVSATMARVEEIKKPKVEDRPIAATATVASSTTEKIKELISMKENGLISEEEFERKREELISKM